MVNIDENLAGGRCVDLSERKRDQAIYIGDNCESRQDSRRTGNELKN